MYQNILVGTDVSATAARAVDCAVELAAGSGARLTILAAARPERSEAIVAAEAERHAGRGVTRGIQGLTRFFQLGSVPSKVSHHVPCTLLIVKTT